jgi:hypothetical protein
VIVSIVNLDRGYSIWCWLCPNCKRARVKAGFDVKETRKPPHALRCQDCGKMGEAK